MLERRVKHRTPRELEMLRELQKNKPFWPLCKICKKKYKPNKWRKDVCWRCLNKSYGKDIPLTPQGLNL